MNLPDFSNDKKLNLLRESMEATYISWDSQARWDTFDPGELLSQLESVGIDLDDIREVFTARDGTLEYRGHKVVVYIRDQIGVRTQYRSNEWNTSGYKFHLADCQTLKSMKTAGRYGRYVVSNRKDGKFIVNFQVSGRIEEEDVECTLGVCINCLRRISYQGYNQKSSMGQKKIRDEFSLENFFKSYRSSISQIPRHTEQSAPKNEYSDDWNNISSAYRQRNAWGCEKCGSFMSIPSDHKYLHVHHINGLKNDNRYSNLKALCIACHAEEPQHGHLKSHPDYNKYLDIKRRRRPAY